MSKFVPVQGTDSMLINGTMQNIATKHHCIAGMEEYGNKSLEELRMEDYRAGLKGPQSQTGQPAGILNTNTPLFSNPTSNTTNTGGFGIMSNSFAVNNQANTTQKLFSEPVNCFGVPTATTSAFAVHPTTPTTLFSSSTQQNNFGVPTQTSLFSNANTNQPAPSVVGVSNTPTSLFPAPQQNRGVGLFTQTSPFNMASIPSNSGIYPWTSLLSGGTRSNLFSSEQPEGHSFRLFPGKPVGSFGPIAGDFNSAPATGFKTNAVGPTNTSTSLFNNAPFKPANQASFFSQTPASGTSSVFGPTLPDGFFNNTSTGSLFNNTGGFPRNSMPSQGSNFMGNTLGTNPMQHNLNLAPVHQARPINTYGTAYGLPATPGGLFNNTPTGSLFNNTGGFPRNFMPSQGSNFMGNTLGTNPMQHNLNLAPVHQARPIDIYGSAYGPSATPGGLFNNTSTGSLFNNTGGFSMNSMPGQSTNFMGNTLGTNPMQHNLNLAPVHQARPTDIYGSAYGPPPIPGGLFNNISTGPVKRFSKIPNRDSSAVATGSLGIRKS